MPSARTERDWPGVAVAVACIGLGAYVLYESQSFTRFAAIFPRTVAIVMMLAAAAWIVLVALGFGRPSPTPDGSLWRSFGLIAVGAGWAALIPLAGFLPASIIGFIGAMVLAKYHAWTARTWAGFVVLAAGVVSGAYALFKFALNVPL